MASVNRSSSSGDWMHSRPMRERYPQRARRSHTSPSLTPPLCRRCGEVVSKSSKRRDGRCCRENSCCDEEEDEEDDEKDDKEARERSVSSAMGSQRAAPFRSVAASSSHSSCPSFCPSSARAEKGSSR